VSTHFVSQRAARSCFLVAVFGAASLFASPGHAQLKGAWADGVSHDQSFARVLVVGISPDLNQRCAFERAMVSVLKSDGTQAFVSCDVMPLRSELTRENIEAAVAAKDADAVFATSLISQSWDTKEGGTNDTRGFGQYKAIDSYYGVYGSVVAADFHAAKPLTSVQGEARVVSKLYETKGAMVVYTVETRIRKVESRSEALGELTPPIAKKLRREGLIRE